MVTTEREVKVEIPPAVVSNIHTQTYQNKEGFRGILIGHIVSSKKKILTDRSEVEKTTVLVSVEACLVVDDLDSILQSDGKIDSLKLVEFCRQRIPQSFLASEMSFLGLLSYYPDQILVSEFKKDKYLLAKMYMQEKRNPKILIHLNSKSKISTNIITTSSKVTLIDDGQWKHDVCLTIPNLGLLPNVNYMEPKIGGLVTSGAEDIEEEKWFHFMMNECESAADRIKSMAEKLFEHYKNTPEESQDVEIIEL